MKHTGGCHCGQVRFEVEMKLAKAISCNCSICEKRGSLLDFAPESNFKLIAGEKSLKDYQFNKKVIHHLFCSNCGIMSFGKGVAPDGSSVVAVNIRCIDNVDINKIEIQHFDGRSI